MKGLIELLPKLLNIPKLSKFAKIIVKIKAAPFLHTDLAKQSSQCFVFFATLYVRWPYWVIAKDKRTYL